MGLLDLLSSPRLQRQAERLANEVAHMTADSVYDRVAPAACRMSESMARGYVRAHAAMAVRTAISRVREARATTRSTQTQLWPTADAGGSARASGTGSEAGVPGVTGFYTLAIDASWEIDAFGAIRSTIDAASATADARAADLQDVLITLTADVALNYIDIRSLQRRLELTRSNVDLQQETLELTQFRAQAGLATDLDVQQALSNVESTRAQIASLEGQVAQSIHAIAILLGQPPAALIKSLSAEWRRS